MAVETLPYDGYLDLGEKLWAQLCRPVGMPHLEDADLKLLDEAISILNPPEAHVRVVEVETFLVRAPPAVGGTTRQPAAGLQST